MVAAFEANAESVTVTRLAATTCANGGAARSASSCAPIQCESPLASMHAASEKPPPSSTSVSHCTKRSDAGSSTRRPPTRHANSTRLASIAMPASTCAVARPGEARAQRVGERLADDPERRGGEEHREHDPLARAASRRAARPRARARVRPTSARGRVRAPDAPEREPHDRQEQQHERDADRRELEERDLGAALRQEARELRARHRADLGADAADVRAVGDREHHRRAVAGEAPARLALELGDQREPDREHHRRGRGVRDPQRDARRGEQQAEQEAPRVGADHAHHGSAMRRCRFHCCIAAAMPMPPRNRKM